MATTKYPSAAKGKKTRTPLSLAAKPLPPELQAHSATALQRAAAFLALQRSTPADMLTLQRGVGNRALNRMLVQRKIQAKRKNSIQDSDEQEAPVGHPTPAPALAAHAGALLNTSRVQLKPLFMLSKTHVREMTLAEDATPSKSTVEKSPKGRELKKLELVEASDTDTNHVKDGEEYVWYRLKKEDNAEEQAPENEARPPQKYEFVRAKKTYELGYTATRKGLKGLRQVDQELDLDDVEEQAVGGKPEDLTAGVLGSVSGGLSETAVGTNRINSTSTTQNGMTTVSTNNHDLAGGSGVVYGAGGLVGFATGMRDLVREDATWEERVNAIFSIISGGLAMETAAFRTAGQLQYQAGGQNPDLQTAGWLTSVEGIFSAVKSGFGTIMNLIKIIQMVAEDDKHSKEEYFEQTGRIVRSALETASGVAGTVRSFWSAVEGSTPAVLGQIIPGLDIAISGVTIIMKGYYLIASAVRWNQMRKARRDLKASLIGGKDQDDYKDRKAALKEAHNHYQQQEAIIAVNQKLKDKQDKKIEKLTGKDDEASQKKLAKATAKRDTYEENIDNARLELLGRKNGYSHDDVGEFALVEELKGANRKRVVRQSLHLTAEAAKIAGAITTLSGVAAPAGVALKASAMGLDLSLPIFRAIKQFGRNHAAKKLAQGKTPKLFNPYKATDAKLDSRKRHAIRILKIAADWDGRDAPRRKQIEMYIRATGCSLKKLYNLNGNPIDQVKLLATEMAKREFA